MSRIIKCDRCGGEVNPKKIGYVSIMQRAETGDLKGDNPFENMDFCENCMTMIADFISAKVATRTEKAKSSRVRAISVMDVGKVRALAEAGWSRDKIADEMGWSVPTVSKYLEEGKEC